MKFDDRVLNFSPSVQFENLKNKFVALSIFESLVNMPFQRTFQNKRQSIAVSNFNVNIFRLDVRCQN